MKCGYGKAAAEFERLASVETDEHVLWPYATAGRGYGVVYEPRRFYVHREALAGRTPQPSPDLRWALHGPGCPISCMNYRHLRWGTPSDNNADALAEGHVPVGEQRKGAKLTQEMVKEIRRQYFAGLTQRALAQQFGVTQSTISNVVSKRTWGHI